MKMFYIFKKWLMFLLFFKSRDISGYKGTTTTLYINTVSDFK